MKARGFAAAAAAIALLLVTTIVGGSSCGTPSFDKKTVAQLDQAVEKNMSMYKVPGAIVGVWQDGKGQYLKVFGKADIESRARHGHHGPLQSRQRHQDHHGDARTRAH